MSSEPESRKLSDLRVVDLRSELEKRGLDKSGNKQALLDRLQKALQDEGLDPDNYQFDTDKKPAKRLSTSSSQPENDSIQKDPSSEAAEEESEDILDASENIGAIDSLEEQTDTSKTDSSKKEKANEAKTEELPLENAKKTGPVEEKESKVTQEQSKKEEIKAMESKEPELKEDGPPAEAESPIRLTLEEEEAFQDEEVDPVPECNKQNAETEKPEKGDKKNTSNKNQEHAAKEIPVNSEKTQDSKKQDGNATSVGGASASKSASKSKKGNSQNRNLWITNISQTTRATELKQALSSYGKVIGAKVVINAKYPGACCYGYVTMDTVEDADNCIAKLNNTELNGQIIRIEKVRPDHMNSVKLNPKLKSADNKDDKGKLKTTPHKLVQAPKSQEFKEEEKKDSVKDGEKGEKKDEKKDAAKEAKNDGHKSDSSTGRRRDPKRRSRSQDTKIRERDRRRSDSKGSRPRHTDKDVLTFDKIKEERERQRLRERERIVREENRRRREEAARQREIERLQRSEAARLEREREKLRLEREKLEREKAEIIRLERERQKLEREKLELEKLELQRAKMRMQEEDRRAVKRTAPYRREGSYEDRKRMTGERRYEESPPPPRFDPASVKARDPTPPPKKFGSATKDYKSRVGYDKRESYPSKRDREYETERSHPQSSISRGPPTSITKYEGSSVFNISRERDMRDARPRDNSSSVSNSRIPKDSRYNERDRERSPHYRPVRDERDRRAMPDHKGDVRSSRDHRYAEPSKDSQRFDRNAGGNSWNHPNASSNKVFNAGGSGAPPKSWSKDWRPTDSANNSERWNSGNVSRGTSSLSTTAFSGNSNLNLGPSCPPPPAINNYAGDRFEYKSMSNIRKY